MASAPYTRIAHLLRIPITDLPTYMQPSSWQQTPRTATPTTLSGDPDRVCSYDLPIAYRHGDGYMVYDAKNSATTNRHVHALKVVLKSQGYKPTDETETNTEYKSYPGYRVIHTYQKYVRDTTPERLA